ncbi:hypothetical protein AB0F52_01440 [Amycolatopsis sp. NPDC024027]|uniref:hypothetical protein n=1 Tax=Amycolatopsis sp. NPDC024027 TaxID=3154327 RepID=UPI0033CCDCF7
MSIRSKKEAANGCVKETPEWVTAQVANLFDKEGMGVSQLRGSEARELVRLICPAGRFPGKSEQQLADELGEELLRLLPEVATVLVAHIMTRYRKKSRRELRGDIHAAAKEALLILFGLRGSASANLSSADRRDKATGRLRRAGIHMEPETFSKNYQDACIEALGNCLYELIK